MTIPISSLHQKKRRKTQSKLSNADIAQWLDNDEHLYLWWKGSRQPKTVFIRENRAYLVSAIRRVLNAPPQR